MFLCTAVQTNVEPKKPYMHAAIYDRVVPFFHSVYNFLGFQLVKTLVSRSGSGIPLNQDIEPSKFRAQLSHATLRFLDWLSSATLKKKFSGISS